MTRSDWQLIAILILLGLGGLAWRQAIASVPGGRGDVVLVEVNGRLVQTLPLDRPATVEIPGPYGPSTLEIDGARARLSSTHCPRRICELTGWISSPGQSIICVPNRIVVRISRPSAGPPGVDAVAR